MSLPAQPDLAQVRVAVAAIEIRQRIRQGKTPCDYAPKPEPQDAALRKPLKSHGNPCRSGFSHPSFYNND